jgi:hypothetical protein
MKRLYTLILIATTFLTISCRKEEVKPKHEVTFEIEFLEYPGSYKQSWWTHGCIFKNTDQSGDNAGLTFMPTGYMRDISKWTYTKSNVEEGDLALFHCYHLDGAYSFIMRIYIDGEVVSWKECNGFHHNIVDEGGWDNNELEAEFYGYGGYDENGEPFYSYDNEHYSQDEQAIITHLIVMGLNLQTVHHHLYLFYHLFHQTQF